jgi:valyl-tRNA synthetase
MSNGGSYDPHAVEDRIYQFWEQGGYFHARPDPDKKPYVIDIPLPNVTGALHLGHALNNTLQDILIRHKRMCGYAALWMPGMDHAGIATQAVVERRLKEEQNLTRHELGREGLVQKIWEWKEKFGGQILTQLRKMGFSCDWERTRFTLDEVCAKAVYEVFFRWFKDGLIYRGTRLVNWDAFLQTAVADDEIVHETVKGSLWHYRYPIVAAAADPRVGRSLPEDVARAALSRAVAPDAKYGVDYLTIATTRPETMLGDTAVAVHPDDERYRHLIGKFCLLPLQNRAIPIIGDAILVKKEFGTGCVKVTPAHDPNDYAFGQRHPEAAAINILTPDGKINENGGAYKGLDRYDARKKVVADLEALGLMEKIEPYETEVGHSDRSKTPIEPMLSEQWFVNMGDLAEMAMEAVRDGRVEFFPERYAKTYLDWLGEKRDWCISRQLWWGHRIPVWTMLTHLGGAMDDTYDQRVLAANDAGVNELRAYLGAAGIRPDEYDIRPRQPDKYYFRVCARNRRAYEALEGLGAFRKSHEPKEVRPDGSFEPALASVPGFSQATNAALALANIWEITQDPDVLDTWFSSALWPFSTLGWPHANGGEQTPPPPRGRLGEGEVETLPHPLPKREGGNEAQPPTRADFDYFFPTSVLITGRGIITLWVARMVITALYFNKRVPFQHVHIHPIIQDGQGRTMSKSLGNGVDPLDIITLYGTDALRFTMAQMDTETQDVRMPVKPVKLPDGRRVNSSEKFELGRNFCNKIWQAATGFVLPNLEGIKGSGDRGIEGWPRALRPDDLAIEDRWILSRLAGCIAEVDSRLEHYQISEVANTLYAFFWSDFCDWYVELVKPRLFARDDAGEITPRDDDSAAIARQVLVWVLDQSLRLLHPIVPFLTEALWQQLKERAPQRGLAEIKPAEEALIVAQWPRADARDPQVEREMTALQDVIRALRDTLARINTNRSAAKQPAIGKIPHALLRADESIVGRLSEQHAVIERLGRCERLETGTAIAKPPESATQVLAGVEVYVPLHGLMDLDVERKRLMKERDELRGHVERLNGKLANEGFVSKAPAAVVEQERARLAEMNIRLASIERNLANVSA